MGAYVGMSIEYAVIAIQLRTCVIGVVVMLGIFGLSNSKAAKLGGRAAEGDEQANKDLLKYRRVFFGEYPNVSEDVVAEAAATMSLESLRVFVGGADSDSQSPAPLPHHGVVKLVEKIGSRPSRKADLSERLSAIACFMKTDDCETIYRLMADVLSQSGSTQLCRFFISLPGRLTNTIESARVVARILAETSSDEVISNFMLSNVGNIDELIIVAVGLIGEKSCIEKLRECVVNGPPEIPSLAVDALVNFEDDETDRWLIEFAQTHLRRLASTFTKRKHPPKSSIELALDRTRGIADDDYTRYPDYYRHSDVCSAADDLPRLTGVLRTRIAGRVPAADLNTILSLPARYSSHDEWQDCSNRGYSKETIVWDCTDLQRIAKAELDRRV